MLLQEYEKQLNQIISILPTRYQSVGGYNILYDIFCELEIAIKGGWFSKEPPPRKEIKDNPFSKNRLVHRFKMLTSKKYRSMIALDLELQEIGQGYVDGGIAWKPIPVFGTIDVGRGITAYITESATEPLIIVSEEIFPMASMLSNIISKCFPVKIENESYALSNEYIDWVNHLSNEDTSIPIIRLFSDLMLSLLLYNSPGMTRPKGVYEYNTIHGVVASKLTHTIEKFIICHEYCHYLLGHPGYQVNDLDDLFYPVDTPANAVKEMVRNHTCEWEADMYGAIVTILSDILSAANEEEYRLSSDFDTLAIYSCFWMFEFLDRLQNLREGANSKTQRLSATHPAPRNRILRYRRDVVKSNVVYMLFGINEDCVPGDKLASECTKIDDHIQSQLNNLDYAFDLLWDNFEILLTKIIESIDSINSIEDLKNMDYALLQEMVYGCK